MFENSQVVYDFQQNELLDGNVSQSKLEVQFVNCTTKSKMARGKCKKKYLNTFFYIYTSQKNASGFTFHNLMTVFKLI